MAVTYGVIGHSEDEVRAALAELCDLLGVRPLGSLLLMPNEKWLGRTTPPVPSAITSDRV
jgi:hypothetical protein